MDFLKRILQFDAVPSLHDAAILIVVGAAILCFSFLVFSPIFGSAFTGMCFVFAGFSLACRRYRFVLAYSGEAIQSHLRWRFIEKLLASRHSSVEILPSEIVQSETIYAIMCTGDWTNYKPMRFSGVSIMECLENAETAMIEFRVKRDRSTKETTPPKSKP